MLPTITTAEHSWAQPQSQASSHFVDSCVHSHPNRLNYDGLLWGREHCPCEWGENGNYETYSIIGLANYEVCLASVLLLSELQDN